MNNIYEVRGSVVAIVLRRRDGTTLEALIDTEDVSRADELNGRWYAFWNPYTKSFYVRGRAVTADGAQTIIPLHRWILKTPKHLDVDHIDHNTLNNCRVNLRESTKAENQQNRIGPNKTRTKKPSGFRGVS